MKPQLIAVACFVAGCNLPSGLPFTGGGAPRTPPPPSSSEPSEGGPDDPSPPPPPPNTGMVVESRSRTTESRSEEHLINGKPIGNARGGGGGAGASRGRDDGLRHPTASELDSIVSALERIPMVDRHRQLRNLIDPYYFTVADVGLILTPIPMPDHRRALETIACSVTDPEHAGDITKFVQGSNASDAVSTLTQKCFAKFPYDRRPPGKMAQKAAPPPGAYRLPGED